MTEKSVTIEPWEQEEQPNQQTEVADPAFESVKADLAKPSYKEELARQDAIESQGKLNEIRTFINGIVAESRMPVQGETSYAIYGGKLTEDPAGRMVYDMRLRHVNHDIDRAGDRFLRSVEDHQMKQPLKTFLRNPIKFFNYVPTLMPFVLTKPKAMRYRGEKSEILANVHRLGLDEYYGPHKWGVEYKKPELLKEGVALQDILKSHQLKGRELDKVDRFDAILKAGNLLNEVHRNYGAVGEFNVYAVLFEGVKDGKAVNPVLNLPTIIYNTEKQLGETMKKATDLLDFIISVGSEEWNRDKTSPNVKKSMYLAVSPYSDERVLKMTISLIKRGRLTLPGDEKATVDLTKTAKVARSLFSLHNVQRIGIKKEASATLRDYALEVCQLKLNSLRSQQELIKPSSAAK